MLLTNIICMQEGQAGAISLLLKHGADPSITDKKGRTGELQIEYNYGVKINTKQLQPFIRYCILLYIGIRV